MAKGPIIIYAVITLFILLLISQSPNKSTTRGRHRLKLRSTFNFSHHPNDRLPRDHIPFDPLVADIERRREDKQWERHYFENAHPEIIEHNSDSAPGHERQPEWEDFMDAEDYLNDEEKFNVTDRLLLLFPKIDVDPIDGYISEHELTEWHLNQSEREVMHRTTRELEVHDKNHDGFISFTEYEPPSWVKNSGGDSLGFETGWWREEHFNASDADGDGLLNVTEFNDFLHPADSKSHKLIQWLCREEVRERDSDKDGKVGFKEFFHGMFDLIRERDEEATHSPSSTNSTGESPAKLLFNQLDKDGDGYLSDVELLPVIRKIHPPERYYAKQQADYIITQADTDKDGRLSLTEAIENPYVFYSAIFSEEDDGDDDDYDFHDEFR